MEITTYKEIYHQPKDSIAVPDALRGQGFAVYFMPLSETATQHESNKSKTNGAGDLMRAYFADVPTSDNPDEDFVLPQRSVHAPLKIK